MIKRIVNYIKDSSFKIIYVNESVNIINYDSLLEVKEDLITLKVDNKIIKIIGSNLSINKLLEQEVLVTGLIKSIEM